MGVLRRLAGYTLRHRRRLALVYGCLAGSTVLSLAIPRLLGVTIDTALEHGRTSELVLLAGLVLGISVIRGGLSYGESYLAEYISQHVAYDLRHDFLSRLQSLSFGFHDHQKTGDLMSRATADVESIRFFVSFGLIYSLHILVLVVGVAILLLTIDWQLALVALAAVPVASAIAVRMSRKFRHLWRDVQTETGRMTTVLQENLSGMRVVKTFGAEEHEKEKFRETATQVADKTFTVNRLHAANSSLLNLVFTLVTALVVWYGGWRIINSGGLTAGDLTQFVLYLGLLVFPVRMSGWVVNIFSRAIAAGERILEVLDSTSPVVEAREPATLGRVSGSVRFESVSFRYGTSGSSSDSAQETLRNINLQALPGQKIAVLGAPGSGKSTLVNLIPRFLRR